MKIAETSYNDLTGTVAVDTKDSFGPFDNQNMNFFAKIFDIDIAKYEIIAAEIVGFNSGEIIIYHKERGNPDTMELKKSVSTNEFDVNNL